MFEINARFNFFDESIDLFKDNEPDFYFEKDRKVFKDKKLFAKNKIKKYKNLIESSYKIINKNDVTDLTNAIYSDDIFTGSDENAGSFFYNPKEDESLTLSVNAENEKALLYLVDQTDGNISLILFNNDGSFVYYYDGMKELLLFNDFGKFVDFTVTLKKGDNYYFAINKYVKLKIIKGSKPSSNPYEIKNYNNLKNNSLHLIKRDFKISDINLLEGIRRAYKNNANYVFERIAFMQMPPKRVIIRDFDD